LKIKCVAGNNRKKVFTVVTAGEVYVFPYAKADPPPTANDRIASVAIDRELGGEAFTYLLASGKEGTVHIDHVLEYNQDPSFMRDLLLYRLTLEAQKRVERSSLSRRELIRKLGTSPAQFYRLLDQTNYRKTLDQLLSLMSILDCEVELVVSNRRASVHVPPARRAATARVRSAARSIGRSR
jgi:Cro/C1-type HTH DNA-binding domain